MEKASKMITAAVVLVLCAVAVIGVGYAYTAQTVNSGNTATTEYTVIHQSGDGAYQFASGTDKIDWNTKDYREGTAPSYTYKTDFWLNGATPYTGDTLHGNYMLTKVGESFNLKTEPQAGGTSTTDLTCEIAADKAQGKNGFENVTGTSALFLKIYHKDTSTGAESDVTYFKWDTTTKSFKAYDTNETDENKWTGTAQFTIAKEGSGYKVYTVDVLYGYAGVADDRITTTHDLGSAPTVGVPTATPIDEAILTFTITV